MNNSKQKITTFLMFQDGNAEEAMNFYISLFDDSEIVNVTRYGANEVGKEGSLMHAIFSLNGQAYMCIDSYVKHEFTLTPAMSLYIKCDTKEEIDKAFEKLS